MDDESIQLRSLNGTKLYPITKASLIEDLPTASLNISAIGDSRIVTFYIYKNASVVTEKRYCTVNTVSSDVNVYLLNETTGQMDLYSSKGDIIEVEGSLVLFVKDAPMVGYNYDSENIFNIVSTAQYEIKESTPGTGFDYSYSLYRTADGTEVEGTKINLNYDTKLKEVVMNYTPSTKILKIDYKMIKVNGSTEIPISEYTKTISFIVGKGLKIETNPTTLMYEMSINTGKGLKFDSDNKLSIDTNDDEIVMNSDSNGSAGLVPKTITLSDRTNRTLTGNGNWVLGVTYDSV